MKTDLRICFPERKIYVMRDHNWAYYAWDIAKSYGHINDESLLIHVDEHLDDLYDHLERVDWKSVVTLPQSYQFAAGMNIAEFITPSFAKGVIGTIVYVTNETSDDAFEEHNKYIAGKRYSGKHFKSFDTFTQSKNDGGLDFLFKNRTTILDLDLDFFNLGTQWGSDPFLKSDIEIRSNLAFLKSLEADFVTVALSPEHCGGQEACDHIFQMFLEIFELHLDDAVEW